jgi:glycosyltransferase involved in cell wall biosynthesis
MTIVHVAQSWPRHDDDAHGIFIARYVDALRRTGIDIDVIVPSMVGAVRQPHVTRVRYGPKRWETLAGTGAMHHAAKGPAGLLLPSYIAAHSLALRRARPTLVHAHWWVPTGLSAALAHNNCPLVIHLHGTDAAVAPPGSKRATLARWVLRRADAVLAVSDDLAQWARHVADVDVTVIPMPLHGGLTATAPDPLGPFLGVGRLVREKGFDVLIRAAARANVPVELVGDGPERGALEQLSRSTGAHVTFVGAVSPRELPGFYQRARAVVVPSRREGLGLVAAEAAACGRTVIASDVGGLPEVVGANGYLITADDVAALAELLVNVDVQRGRSGPDEVARLQPDRIARRTLEVYRRLLGE